MTELNKSDCITIKISKAKFAEEFSHWESTVYNNELKIVSECTGPTYIGVMDSALAYIYDEYPVWVEEDANDPR